MRITIEDLNRGFDLDVEYHADFLHTELLIEIARITEWRDHQLYVYGLEADDWLIAQKLAIDINVEITIGGYNDEARNIIAIAHVRIQQETHAAIGRLELEHSLQVKAIADRIRTLKNPTIGGWEQRPGYCRRSYGSFFDTKDILKGARNSDAVSCSNECKLEARCNAFFIGADDGCNLWINTDIGHGSDDDNVEACFHLSNCYVWMGGNDDFVHDPIDFAMGTYAIPDGYRDVCIDELSYDTNLWR